MSIELREDAACGILVPASYVNVTPIGGGSFGAVFAVTDAVSGEVSF